MRHPLAATFAAGSVGARALVDAATHGSLSCSEFTMRLNDNELRAFYGKMSTSRLRQVRKEGKATPEALAVLEQVLAERGAEPAGSESGTEQGDDRGRGQHRGPAETKAADRPTTRRQAARAAAVPRIRPEFAAEPPMIAPARRPANQACACLEEWARGRYSDPTHMDRAISILEDAETDAWPGARALLAGLMWLRAQPGTHHASIWSKIRRSIRGFPEEEGILALAYTAVLIDKWRAREGTDGEFQAARTGVRDFIGSGGDGYRCEHFEAIHEASDYLAHEYDEFFRCDTESHWSGAFPTSEETALITRRVDRRLKGYDMQLATAVAKGRCVRCFGEIVDEEQVRFVCVHCGFGGSCHSRCVVGETPPADGLVAHVQGMCPACGN